jgi:hypothetical protein
VWRNNVSLRRQSVHHGTGLWITYANIQEDCVFVRHSDDRLSRFLILGMSPHGLEDLKLTGSAVSNGTFRVLPNLRKFGAPLQ